MGWDGRRESLLRDEVGGRVFLVVENIFDDFFLADLDETGCKIPD